jgi:hypothetical protein
MSLVIPFEHILRGDEAEDSNGLIQDDVDLSFSFLQETIRTTTGVISMNPHPLQAPL